MMRRIVFQVAIGDLRPLWLRCIESVGVYCRRHGFEHVVLTEPVLLIAPKKSARSENALRLGYLPIFEKWNAYPLLRECDEIAIVDADVYAMANAGSIFEAVPMGYDFAAAVERQMPITPVYARKLDRYALGQYGDKLAPFRNMGVEVVRPSFLRFIGDDPKAFIERPEFAKYVNGEGPYRWQTEQTLLNDFLRSSGASVFDLPWQWNALYEAIPLERCNAASLVHFFLSEHLTGSDPREMLQRSARPRL